LIAIKKSVHGTLGVRSIERRKDAIGLSVEVAELDRGERRALAGSRSSKSRNAIRIMIARNQLSRKRRANSSGEHTERTNLTHIRSRASFTNRNGEHFLASSVNTFKGERTRVHSRESSREAGSTLAQLNFTHAINRAK